MNGEIESRKRNWRDFYGGRLNKVVLVGLNHGGRPWPYPENKEGRIEWALKYYRERIMAMDWLKDDFIPHLSPYTGTEILAEAFGCPVHRPGNGMPFALPLIKNASELKNVKKPKLDESSLLEIFEIADRLRASEPDGIMKLPDIQSPIDVAALIWEKADFFAAMHEEPNAVKELIAMTEEFIIELLDAWFARYGTEFVAHHPDYYMPGGVTLSEDEAGCISPEMFREFSMDSINGLSRRYGSMGIHCCAHAKHQWGNFKEVENLVLLNLVQPAETIEEAYGFFNNCGQMHSEPPGDTHRLRVVMHGEATGKDEAKELFAKLKSA